jgi:hypothetical protein
MDDLPPQSPRPPSDPPDGADLGSLVPVKWALDLISEQSGRSHELKKTELNHQLTRFVILTGAVIVIFALAPNEIKVELFHTFATFFKDIIKIGVESKP